MNQEAVVHIFSETFDEFSDAIFRFCMVKVSHVEQAEDMTQEVFTRYWQYLRAGKEMTNTRSLLYTIANNLAKDWYKKKKADSLDDQMALGSEPIDQSASPATVAAYHEVLTTINELDESDRVVLLLTHVEGLPRKEIAAVLGETANVISVRLNRATKRLQHKLHT